MTNNRDIIKFLISLGLFIGLLFILDQILGWSFQNLYFRQKVGQFYQTTYSVERSNQDILVFGSSRAVRHYAPGILSKNLGLSTYNMGRDGQMIPFSAALEELALNRHKPKIIILDINPWELDISPEKFEKLTILLPYYAKHKELLKYIHEISKFEDVKLLSKTYPYNSSIFVLAACTLFPRNQGQDDHGYVPLSGSISQANFNQILSMLQDRYAKIKGKENKMDTLARKYLVQFLDLAKKDQIKTYLIISPTISKDYFKWDNQLKQKSEIESIGKQYANLTYLDYSSDSSFNNHPEKFADQFHLNESGSKEFSQILVQEIKKREGK